MQNHISVEGDRVADLSWIVLRRVPVLYLLLLAYRISYFITKSNNITSCHVLLNEYVM